MTGGNIVVSFVVMPALRESSLALDRVKVFCKTFDRAAPWMVSFGLIASAAYGTAAYFAPTPSSQNALIAASAFSFGILPFTVVFIFPTVFKLKDIKARLDSETALSQGDGLLKKWTTLNTVRMSLMAVGSLIGLKELYEWNLW